MRYTFAFVLFAVAGASAWTLAPRLTALAEARYAAQVDAALHAGGYRWATGDVDGLTVTLSGPAPSEAAEREALTVVSAISPVLAVRNEITEAPEIPSTVIPPRLEILKSEDSLILTGVVQNEAMIKALDPNATMLTYGAAPFTADWPTTAPTLKIIADRLTHVRISLYGDTITITGVAATPDVRAALQPQLRTLTALGWRAATAIDAPPPVLSTFELVASRSVDEGAVLSCSAATQTDAETIEAAAQTHLGVRTTCKIGAGAPDAAWAEAATATIAALAKTPAARATIVGKIVSLTTSPPTTTDEVEAARQALTASLPAGYRLTIDERALASPDGPAVPPFRLTIDWPGDDAPLSITGTLTKAGFDTAAPTLNAFARAQFPGVETSLTQTNGAAPPAGWRQAARTALKALSHLDNGSTEITDGKIVLTGATQNLTALRTAHDTLMQAGEAWRATTRIAYDPARIAAAQPVPPTRCAVDVAEVIAKAPLSFQPASTTLTTAAQTTIADIAAILTRCEDTRFEIGGHTDAQGSEAGNLALSRRRAEAVLTALASANARPGQLIAKGYGEARPIASNDTAVGRALNRRIEFTLIEDPE